MAEYIDRQAAVDALARLCKRVCEYSEKQRQYMCGACPLGDAFTVIEDDLPAADVRPVVRGKWELSDDRCWHTCSIGGADIDVSVGLLCYVDNEEVCNHNFCPNCGADMREES